MSYPQLQVNQVDGPSPSVTPVYAKQCSEIKQIIRELKEKLVYVSIEISDEGKKSDSNGHLNGELQVIIDQLRELSGNIQY